MKKRVLFFGEPSFAHSGFAINQRELIQRFHRTGKYILAEFCLFGADESQGETQHMSLPWFYYPNLPATQEEAAEFRPGDYFYRHGGWKLDKVIEEFQSNIIISTLDPWQYQYLISSKYRHTYKLFIMPPIDSEENDPALNTYYENADGVFTCTEWAAEIIQRNPRIKFKGVVYPGLNEEFQPVRNKAEHKRSIGWTGREIVFGSVMRNMPRKLFPNIARTFSRLRQVLPTEVWERCRLYWHCKPSDEAWNIPRLIIENNIGDKVYMTYRCECGFVQPSLYSGPEKGCQCGSAMTFPSSKNGVSEKALCQIYNLFDCCVQYSKAAGFERQSIEAGCLNIPVIVNDHSGMKDMAKLGARTVRNLLNYTSHHDHREFAVPDDNHLLEHMADFAKNPEPALDFGRKVRKLYSWQDTSEKWMGVVDESSPTV